MESSLNMSCKITLSDDRKYVVIRYTGEINKNIIMPFIVQAHVLARKNNIDKFYMDMTSARNTDSFSDICEFSYADTGKVPEINTSAVVAAVVDPEDHSHDFIERLLWLNGVDILLFTSREKAVSYLHETPGNRKIIREALRG